MAWSVPDDCSSSLGAGVVQASVTSMSGSREMRRITGYPALEYAM